MTHQLSPDDETFRADLEAGRVLPQAFDHRAHVRLAYTYLVEHDDDTASARMRDALLGFLGHHGIGTAKYHETITGAWILAVRHFMERSTPAATADEFIERNPTLLDAKIMLTHYSAETLFSDEARGRFLEPDLDEIPRHGA